MRTGINQQLPSISHVAKAIRLPWTQWGGQCHAVASQIKVSGLLDFPVRLVRGHYHGPVHSLSLFSGRAFSSHTWLEGKGVWLDPTHWVFTHTPPVWRVIELWHPDYDFAGTDLYNNRVSKPEAKSDSRAEFVVQSRKLLLQLRRVFDRMPKHGPTLLQWSWLAHQHHGVLPTLDFPLMYHELKQANRLYLVPIDLRCYWGFYWGFD